MGDYQATGQADNITPPRKGAVAAITVDATARPYDLTALTLATKFRANTPDWVYITLQNDGSADIYFYFNSATDNTLDNTAIQAAGATLAFAATACGKIPVGQSADLRIRRDVDQFLIVKTASGTTTLRLWASSNGGIAGVGEG